MIWNPLDNCEYATLSRGHKWTLQVGYRSGNRHLNYWGRISTLGISPIAQPRLRVMASHDGIAHLCPLALGLEASGTHACPRRPGDISYHCMLRLRRLRQQRTLSRLIPPRRWILIAWGSSDFCLAENLPAQSPTKLRGTLGTYGAGPWACHRPGYIYALHRQTPRPTRHCWNDMHMQTKFKWGDGG